MNRFSRLHKIFWRALFAKISLLFAIMSFLILLTAFASAILVMDYDWSMLMAAIVCLAPWLALIIMLFVMLFASYKNYQQEKDQLLNNSRNALISRAILFIVQFIITKRKQAKARTEG